MENKESRKEYEFGAKKGGFDGFNSHEINKVKKRTAMIIAANPKMSDKKVSEMVAHPYVTEDRVYMWRNGSHVRFGKYIKEYTEMLELSDRNSNPDKMFRYIAENCAKELVNRIEEGGIKDMNVKELLSEFRASVNYLEKVNAFKVFKKKSDGRGQHKKKEAKFKELMSAMGEVDEPKEAKRENTESS